MVDADVPGIEVVAPNTVVMREPPESAGGRADALRHQIETGLRAAERDRRIRMAIMAGAGLLALSLLLNLLVLASPGSVGLASAGDVDAVRESVRQEVASAVADQEASAAEALAATRAAARVAARPGPADAALPGICATLTALGDWSFVNGQVPDSGCPVAP